MTHHAETHPLAQTFARAGVLNEYLTVHFGEASGEGWLAAAGIFTPDGERFATLATATRELLHTTAPNIVGSSLLQSYQWPVVASAIACYLLDQRIPDLDPHTIFLRYNDEGEADAVAFTSGRFTALPGDPAADHEDARIVPHLGALQAALREALEAYFGGTITQLCESMGCKPRGLWLNVVDGCANAFAWLMQKQNQAIGIAAIEAELEALMHGVGSPFNTPHVSYVELTYCDRTEVFLDRATCCYYYKTDGGEYCDTCPHRTPADRHRRLLDYMAEVYEEEKVS